MAAVASGSVIAVASPHLLDELAEVVVRPRFRRWFEPRDAVDFLDRLAAIVEKYPDPLDPPPSKVRDPADDYLVALAKLANAYLVTGDADLLDCADDVRTISVTDFLRLLV